MRLVYITLIWVTGLVLASGSDLSSLMWVVIAVWVLLAAWLTRRAPLVFRLHIGLLVFVLAGLRFSLVPGQSDVSQFNNTGGLTLIGAVVTDPDVRDTNLHLRVRVDQMTRGDGIIETSGLVLVTVARGTDVSYGDRIAVTGLLLFPEEFDTFSYADYLARQGIYSIMRNAIIRIVDDDGGSPILKAIYSLRRRAAAHIARALPEPQAGLLTGILLGNERGISPELQGDFSRVGASHVIAISGFNMVIVAGVVVAVLNRVTDRRRVSGAISIVVIALYTLLVGANAAVVRAALMSALLIIGTLLKRRTYVPASLAFAALIMSLHNPYVLWDISFQLSFFATLGLALFADPLGKWFNSLLVRMFPASMARSVGGLLMEPLVVTAAAQITALPLVALYFQRLSLLVLGVNVLIVPVQAALLITGGLATMIAFIAPFLAQIIFWISWLLLSWTIGVVRLFAQIPFADVPLHTSGRVIFLYFAVMIGWAMMNATQPGWWLRLVRFIRQQAVMTGIVFSGMSLSLLMGAVAISRPDGYLHVWFLDVGHSNAVLVQTPGGAHMLVDGGRFPSRLLTAIGDRLPFTDRQIEVLVLTQPDEFDISAVRSVVDRYSIGVTLTNGQPNLSDYFLDLQNALEGRPVVAVTSGYTLDFSDGARLEVLHPQTQPRLGDSFDDNAVVVRLSYGDISFLLTADASVDAQRGLLQAGMWPLATVLQLPQHGTARSLASEFLSAVQPQVVVVQSDRANRRGDPDPDVLARLGDIPLYRTDHTGVIHLWTDGVRLWTSAGQSATAGQ